MAEFDSWLSYRCFEQATRREFRYIRTEPCERFLTLVRESAIQHKLTLDAGSIFWRARLGSEWKDDINADGSVIGGQELPLPPGEMIPRTWCANEGRANPKGIPYLYLSDKRDTALSETRPWVEASVSAAQFRLIKKQTIVNCASTKRFTTIYLKEPSADKKAKAIWAHIDQAFATPVTQNESSAEYTPTQVLAEMFKSAGYDGIRYRSSVGTGHNVVLFNLDSVTLHGCCVYKAKKIRCAFEQASNPYVVADNNQL
jgi:RES domain-containing protein